MEFEGFLFLGFLVYIAIFATQFLVIAIHWIIFLTVGLLTPVILTWGGWSMAAGDVGELDLSKQFLSIYFGLVLASLITMLIERIIFANTHLFPWKVNLASDRALAVSDKTSALFIGSFRLFSKPIIWLFSPIFRPVMLKVEGRWRPLSRTFDAFIEGVEKYFPVVLSAMMAGVIIISYLLSVSRWFLKTHISFWEGLKELIWALTPIINITYVWDLWVTSVGFVIRLWTILFG